MHTIQCIAESWRAGKMSYIAKLMMGGKKDKLLRRHLMLSCVVIEWFSLFFHSSFASSNINRACLCLHVYRTAIKCFFHLFNKLQKQPYHHHQNLNNNTTWILAFWSPKAIRRRTPPPTPTTRATEVSTFYLHIYTHRRTNHRVCVTNSTLFRPLHTQPNTRSPLLQKW